MTDRHQKVSKYFQNFIKLWMLSASMKDSILDKFNLSPSHSKLLYSVFLSQKVTTSELSKTMSISNAAVTQLIDKLIASGYLQREENPEDRRIAFISFTKKGEKMFSQFHQTHIELLDKWMDKLNDDELDILLKLQDKILK